MRKICGSASLTVKSVAASAHFERTVGSFGMAKHWPFRDTDLEPFRTVTHPEITQRNLNNCEAIMLHVRRVINAVPSSTLSRKQIMCVRILQGAEQL